MTTGLHTGDLGESNRISIRTVVNYASWARGQYYYWMLADLWVAVQTP
jgi:hypothetical protein